MTVVAAYNLSGGRIEPYCTLDEVKFSPTAAAIDFTNLIENASQTVQDRALSELIVRASAKADQYTMGLYGSLNATVNTETGRETPNRSGQIAIHPYFSPILEIREFMVGWGPGDGMSAVTLSPSNCYIEREKFIITSNSAMGLYFGGLGIAGGQWTYMSEVFCQYTYVNGWANTFSTAQTAVGDTTIAVTDSTGIYPGMFMTIWDGMNDEYVQIATTYVPGTDTLTLATPLRYKHGVGVNVSALPPTVKQAVIHFVVAMIKERGQGGLVLNEIGEPMAMSGKGHGSLLDESQGYDLLDEFRAIWGRT